MSAPVKTSLCMELCHRYHNITTHLTPGAWDADGLVYAAAEVEWLAAVGHASGLVNRSIRKSFQDGCCNVGDVVPC